MNNSGVEVKINGMKDNYWYKLFLISLSSILLGLSWWVLHQELQHHPPQEIIKSLLTISRNHVVIAIGLTIISYLVITCYDIIAFCHLNYSLAVIKVILTAFFSYAISNTTGFGLLIGGGIRYRYYSFWQVPPKKIAQVIGLANLSFWLGLFAVGGITFIFEPLPVPRLLHVHFLTVRPLGIFFLVMVGVYLYYCWHQKTLSFRQQMIVFPSLSISLAQILVSALDWALATAVLYVLLPTHNLLSYFSFFGIYLLAITAAIISHVPGGLGVFETVILFLLPKSFSTSDVLGSLLAYRGIYFLLPLIIAVIGLGIFEIRQKTKRLVNRNKI